MGAVSVRSTQIDRTDEAKQTFTVACNNARKTGGDPSEKNPTATEENIIDLIKYIPNFRIAMGFKSSMQTASSTVYFKLKMDRKLVLSSK